MIHGGDVYSHGILKGIELLDFSSNINPLGVPKSFVNNIGEALNSMTRYPDIKYREALKSLKGYTGVEEHYFVLGNGAAEIIDLAISCFKRVLIVVPSFAEYEISAKKWDCSIEYSELSKDMNFNYDDIYNKLQTVEALIIGNPNNPNGGTIDKTKFKPILDFCERESKTVIIDEAFIEFTKEKSFSFIDELKDYKCIFIIRALTKFFAMPGIRFGYGISKNVNMLQTIRKKQNPWNINCFAELAIKYVLKDEEYIKKSKEWIEEERDFFTNRLQEIACIERSFTTFSNYVLCKLKGIDSEKLYNYCLTKGILIRRAHNFKGLDETYVRFAIKDRKANERLLNILSDIKI